MSIVRYPSPVETVELTLENPSGLHARPATLFAQAAARFRSRVTVENLDRGSRPVDAKSVLLVLTAGVQRGHRIRLTADGPDEAEAVLTLTELVASGLGELTAS
jgi:phosphotransferase system HPr (HPr) family protein